MEIEVLYRPSYSVARVFLKPKETIQVESGAMVGMSPDMEMETEAKGRIPEVYLPFYVRGRKLFYEYLYGHG